jgi:hypothetical protein
MTQEIIIYVALAIVITLGYLFHKEEKRGVTVICGGCGKRCRKIDCRTDSVGESICCICEERAQ